jgi:hypothetical protein
LHKQYIFPKTQPDEFDQFLLSNNGLLDLVAGLVDQEKSFSIDHSTQADFNPTFICIFYKQKRLESSFMQHLKTFADSFFFFFRSYSIYVKCRMQIEIITLREIDLLTFPRGQ